MKFAKTFAGLAVSALCVSPLVQAQPSANAQLVLTVQQLQDEIRFLRGELEQQTHQIRQLKRNQQDNYRELDRRISRLAQGGNQPNINRPEAGAGQGAKAAYQQALQLVKARKFDETLIAFDKFVNAYPASPLVANAYYWMGEIHLAKRNPEAAREAFARVVNQYPKHPKRADATYKLAVAYHKLGVNTQAQKYLKAVQSQYPKSSAADLARDYSLN